MFFFFFFKDNLFSQIQDFHSLCNSACVMVLKSSVLILSLKWLAKIKLVFFWNVNAKTLQNYETVTLTQKYPFWQFHSRCFIGEYAQTHQILHDKAWCHRRQVRFNSSLRLISSTNEWVQRVHGERTGTPEKTDFPRAPSFKHPSFTSGANTFKIEARSVAEAQAQLRWHRHHTDCSLRVKTTLFFHSLQTEKEIRNIPLLNMIFKKSRYKYREDAKINDGAPQRGCGSVHLHDNRGTGGQNREQKKKKKMTSIDSTCPEK